MKISTLVRLATYIVVYGICAFCLCLFDGYEPVEIFFAICCWACFIALCVELFILALQLARKSRYEKAKTRLYANIIRDGARRVEDVVSATDLPYDVVQKDLRKLAKKGKGDFQGAYFNEATQEIVFTRNVPAANWNNAPTNAPAPPVANWNNAPANAPAQPAAPRNVCPACGASVARVGNGVCEYCGSPLN